jgi:hypothetical protein
MINGDQGKVAGPGDRATSKASDANERVHVFVGGGASTQRTGGQRQTSRSGRGVQRLSAGAQPLEPLDG